MLQLCAILDKFYTDSDQAFIFLFFYLQTGWVVKDAKNKFQTKLERQIW